MLDTFNSAEAKSRHTTQYFEMAGNRGIYQDGWFATTVHRPPWEAKPRATFANDKWELYNVEKDFSCAHDLAAKYPDKLEKLKGVFLEEAVKYNVLPLDDRSWERFNAALAGRPDLLEGRTEMTVYEGMKGIPENAFINIKNHSFVITADLEVPEAGARGWSLPKAGKWAAGASTSRTAHPGLPTTISVARLTRSLGPLACRRAGDASLRVCLRWR